MLSHLQWLNNVKYIRFVTCLQVTPSAKSPFISHIFIFPYMFSINQHNLHIFPIYFPYFSHKSYIFPCFSMGWSINYRVFLDFTSSMGDSWDGQFRKSQPWDMGSTDSSLVLLRGINKGIYPLIVVNSG